MHNPQILHIKTIEGEWQDNDAIMLHACFQLLTDCIENENLFTGHISWEHDEVFSLAKKELIELYHWWQERVKDENSRKIDPTWTPGQHEKDTEMLIRLVKMRKYLWT